MTEVPFAFDDALRDRIAANLAGHRRRVVGDGAHRRAAVAVVVADSPAGADRVDPQAPSGEDLDATGIDLRGTGGRDGRGGLDGRLVGLSGGAAFLLCRRAPRLSVHASQWALPGGGVEAGETPEVAARRELHEELGVELPASAVLGLLDDYPTRSGYVVTPVVLWGDDGTGRGHLDLRPDPSEVAAAYRVGLHELCRPDSPRFVSIPESDRPVVQVPLGNALIHAPTGAMLVQFRWLALEGRGDPVAHFEQPVFAWR